MSEYMCLCAAPKIEYEYKEKSTFFIGQHIFRLECTISGIFHHFSKIVFEMHIKNAAILSRFLQFISLSLSLSFTRRTHRDLFPFHFDMPAISFTYEYQKC